MAANEVTGLVLAGGLARRMGGQDKGLQPFRGRPLVAHVIERLAPQVAGLVVNANRNLESYAAIGFPVIPDALKDFPGPLAGLHAGLSACPTPLMMAVPCDTPFLPEDLVARLREGLERSGGRLAVAGTPKQPHSLFLLCKREIAADLEAYLSSGGRKVEAWCALMGATPVEFGDESAFANLNTLEELS